MTPEQEVETMSTMMSPGQMVRVENPESPDSEVVVTSVHEDRQDEYRVGWNYDKDPVYIYDYEDNQSYSPESRVIGVVYCDAIESRCERGLEDMTHDDLESHIDDGTLKEYHFPEARLYPLE